MNEKLLVPDIGDFENVEVIEILEANGFQTLAELSITPLEELIAIEGLDANLARSILDQARRMTEKVQ